MKTILDEAEQRMMKSLDALIGGLTKIRAGRAHPSLIESILVESYGAKTPLDRVANINILDAHTLSVVPWDKSLVSSIDKAIRSADLGLNPVVRSDTIRVPLPALNEERRRELIKVVRAEAEQVRVAVRNIRRDAKQSCRDMVKEKRMTEDDERRVTALLQKLVDRFVSRIDELLAKKEQEMLAL